MVDTTVDIPTRVLVLGMAAEDGSIDAGALYDVADACGQTPDQVRSCLRRLVRDALFVRSGDGRGARYAATAAGMAALGADLERTRLAYAQDAAGRGWDRRWRLVAFAVPETRRSGRDALRDRLRALGGAAVQGGLYVSPHPWHADVRAAAAALDLGDAVALATTDDLVVAGERDPKRLAAHLWPVEQLAGRYAAFVERYAGVPERLREMRLQRQKLPDAAFLPGALAVAVAYLDCFHDDPLLPPELLPRPWPGRAARDLVAASRRLALGVRQTPGRPALFRLFDDALSAVA